MCDAMVEAFELARFAEQLAVRLGEAQGHLPAGDDYRNERQWLETAETMLQEQVDPLKSVLSRARLLPELSFLRDEVADEFLNAWVDGLERLLAGITFHAGARAPVIEALFPPKAKLPNLRRATRETAEAFATELERRLKGTYVARIFGQEDMQFVHPVVEEVRKAFAEYIAVFDGTALPDEEAWNLRERLGNAGQRIERIAAQAKLLAEAALLPIEGAYETAGLNLKPKRRASKTALPTDSAESLEDAGQDSDESPIEAQAETYPASEKTSELEDAVASLEAHAAEVSSVAAAGTKVKKPRKAKAQPVEPPPPSEPQPKVEV
ncbi:MAG: hypothetical protein ACT4TC_05295 [Myxococcaceae bacterium]